MLQGTLNIKWIESEIKYKQESKGDRLVVVIPAYKIKRRLTALDIISMKRVASVLGPKYDIVLVVPFGFKTEDYDEVADYKFNYLECNEAYFKKQKSYSDLCEEWQWYNAFSKYEFMLIYQLDAYIFEDRLEYFMSKDYDYIGAPHLVSRNSKGEVGNGGFSLRKIQKFIDVCKETDFNAIGYWQLEDCAFTQRLKDKFNICPLELALEFGFNEKPEKSFENNGNKLPMGFHGFRGKMPFWNKYVEELEGIKDTSELSKPSALQRVQERKKISEDLVKQLLGLQ